MIIDGRKIADDMKRSLREEVGELPRGVILGIITMDPDFATEKFLTIKRSVARELGVSLIEERLPSHSSTQDVIDSVAQLSRMADGIIVQLPLPKGIDTEKVLAAIPASHDVDAIGQGATASLVLPPVVAAMETVVESCGISLAGMQTVVVGAGRLVGAPAAAWLARAGASVEVVRKGDVADDTFKEADLIVLGAGDPGLLQPSMVKEGAIILDAGTSEAGGKLAGDADPLCAERASLFTPVPGGIGPIAVVMIFKNLIDLARPRL